MSANKGAMAETAHSSPQAPAAGSSTGPRPEYASPARLELSDFLLESRNSPEAHKRAFEEAQREHDRVRKAALHVFELHQIAEETRRIEEEERQREERVRAQRDRLESERRAAEKRVHDEARLQALRQTSIPKPVAAPAPAPALAPPPAAAAAAAANGIATAASRQPAVNGFATSRPAPGPGLGPAPGPAATSQLSGPTLSTPPPASRPQTAAVSAVAPAAPPPTRPPPPATATTAGTSATPRLVNGAGSLGRPATPPAPAVDRHVQIHRKLKELRAFTQAQTNSNPALKARMGDMRRDIRKSFGQLTNGGLRDNKIPVEKIIAALREALQQIPSAPVDPGQFVLQPREPVEGAAHNEAQLPSLFLYLMNIMSKAAISQFISESGATTRTADSIGQALAKIYSEQDLLWRGKPLIDLLIAKYRVMCPVLFGFRGNDRMEQGRARVGWLKDDSGRWISEQEHSDRMTGLGAGFAAMTLRDFSRVRRQNPWPPSAYWTALASILNTPPELISMTQCHVLKAMIADSEPRFISFYGNAAVAALRCALIDFPARVPEPSPASSALRVLAKTLSMHTGLNLDMIRRE